MSPWLLLILGGLSVYRVALLFSKEAGPFQVFKSIRRTVPEKSGVGCLLCESVWWSILLGAYAGWVGYITWQDCPLWILSWSGEAVILNFAFSAGSLKK